MQLTHNEKVTGSNPVGPTMKKILILPSVVSTTWKDDLKFFGLPKKIFNTSKNYWKHIGLYDLTIEEFTFQNNKKTRRF